MNCAQFVSGQPGPELPALKFVTDPASATLLSPSARSQSNQHAKRMYTREQSNPGTAKLQLRVFDSLCLGVVAPLRLLVNSLSPNSAYSAYSAVKKPANQNRTKSEPPPRCR